MGSGLKKGKKQMKSYLRTTEEDKAYLWGVRNGLKISPFAHSATEWWIDVEFKDRKKRSPIKYGSKEIWPKIFELYKFYYDKHHREI
jgi:hypothetical protein